MAERRRYLVSLEVQVQFTYESETEYDLAGTVNSLAVYRPHDEKISDFLECRRSVYVSPSPIPAGLLTAANPDPAPSEAEI